MTSISCTFSDFGSVLVTQWRPVFLSKSVGISRRRRRVPALTGRRPSEQLGLSAATTSPSTLHLLSLCSLPGWLVSPFLCFFIPFSYVCLFFHLPTFPFSWRPLLISPHTLFHQSKPSLCLPYTLFFLTPTLSWSRVANEESHLASDLSLVSWPQMLWLAAEALTSHCGQLLTWCCL